MSRIRKKMLLQGIGVIPIRIFSNAIRLSADTIRKPADGIGKIMNKRRESASETYFCEIFSHKSSDRQLRMVKKSRKAEKRKDSLTSPCATVTVKNSGAEEGAR